jgi:hypothetical protein
MKERPPIATALVVPVAGGVTEPPVKPTTSSAEMLLRTAPLPS